MCRLIPNPKKNLQTAKKVLATSTSITYVFMLTPLNSHRQVEDPKINTGKDFISWFLTLCCSSLPTGWASGGALRLPGCSEAPGVAGRSSQRVRHPRQHGEDESGGRKTLPAVLCPVQVSFFPLFFFFLIPPMSLLWVDYVCFLFLLCSAGDSLPSSSRAAVWTRLSCTRCSSTHCSPVSTTHQGQRRFSGLIVFRATNCG